MMFALVEGTMTGEADYNGLQVHEVGRLRLLPWRSCLTMLAVKAQLSRVFA